MDYGAPQLPAVQTLTNSQTGPVPQRQSPPLQVSDDAVQAVPQKPQLLKSELMSVQPPEQQV